MSVETEEARDRQIERLVGEISEVIDNAEPERREELRQMAFDVLQQGTHRAETVRAAGSAARGRPLNMLTLGVGLVLVAFVLFLFVPLMASLLFAAGVLVIALSLLSRFTHWPSIKFRH